jgi:hypothetical protein
MSRREILAAVALAVTSACTSNGGTSQLARDLSLVAQGLGAVEKTLQGIPGVPGAVLAQVQSDLAQVRSAASQAIQPSVGGLTSSVQGIGALVGNIASAVLPLLPGGSVVVTLVEAAVSLVPTIEAEAGLLSAAMVVSAKPRYTPAQARALLASGIG